MDVRTVQADGIYVKVPYDAQVRLAGFLRELTELSKKYKIAIDRGGWLHDLTGERNFVGYGFHLDQIEWMKNKKEFQYVCYLDLWEQHAFGPDGYIDNYEEVKDW